MFSIVIIQKTLLKSHHCKAQLVFACAYLKKDDNFWNSFYGVMRQELFGCNLAQQVCRNRGETVNPRNTMLSLKYGQDNLMLWESFSGNEAGCLFKIFRTIQLPFGRWWKMNSKMIWLTSYIDLQWVWNWI